MGRGTQPRAGLCSIPRRPPLSDISTYSCGSPGLPPRPSPATRLRSLRQTPLLKQIELWDLGADEPSIRNDVEAEMRDIAIALPRYVFLETSNGLTTLRLYGWA